MKQLESLLNAATKFYETAGLEGTTVFALIWVGLVVWTMRRDKRVENAYRTALAAKEEQIQRIAVENRQWRAYFFKQEGLSDDEIQRLLDGYSTPLVAAKKPEKE